MIRNLLPNATIGEPETTPALPGGHAAVRRPFLGRRLLLVGHAGKLPSAMAARKKPWNHGLKMPGLLDEPETVPKVTPTRVLATPSSGLEMSPRHEVKEKAQPVIQERLAAKEHSGRVSTKRA